MFTLSGKYEFPIILNIHIDLSMYHAFSTINSLNASTDALPEEIRSIFIFSFIGFGSISTAKSKTFSVDFPFSLQSICYG